MFFGVNFNNINIVEKEIDGFVNRQTPFILSHLKIVMNKWKPEREEIENQTRALSPSELKLLKFCVDKIYAIAKESLQLQPESENEIKDIILKAELDTIISLGESLSKNKRKKFRKFIESCA